MAEESQPVNAENTGNAEASQIVEAGKVSRWLTENGFEHEALERDHLGVEIIKVEPDFLIPLSTALYAYGFNYLQCQGGYDVGPGEDLVSFYHLIKLSDNASRPEEVRVKVFLSREIPKCLQFTGFGRLRTGRSGNLLICTGLSMKDILISSGY